MANVNIAMTDDRVRKARAQVQSGDAITWRNQGSVQRTLWFSDWPFQEPQAGIVVAVGARESRTVKDPCGNRGYSYAIDPPIVGAGGPDEPTIDVND